MRQGCVRRPAPTSVERACSFNAGTIRVRVGSEIMSSSDKKDNPRIAIVGAGLGGALMATYLGKAGYEVEA